MDKRSWFGLAAVLALTLLASIGSVRNDFVWDDTRVIRDGTVIHDISKLPAAMVHRTLWVVPDEANNAATGTDTYRPLSILTFFLDAAVTGHNPVGYHITNAALHLACTALVFFFARLSLGAELIFPIVFSSLFFGLSPQLAEAHVWINGRSDLVATLFGLSAFYVLERKKNARDLWVAAALFGIGLFGKEVLVCALPLVAVPLTEPLSLREKVKRLATFAAACVPYVFVRLWVLGGVRAYRESSQTWLALKHLPLLWIDGALELLAPQRLYLRSLVDDYREISPAMNIAAAAVVLLIAGVLFFARKKRPILAWGGALFACALAPAAMISTTLWYGFGRYLYLPAVGMALVLGQLVAYAMSWASARDFSPRLLPLTASAYLALLGLRLFMYVGDWHDDITVFQTVTREAPNRAHGWAGLGFLFLTRGLHEQALTEFLRADELGPTTPRYLDGVIQAYAGKHDNANALKSAEDGMRRFPNEPVFVARAADLHLANEPELAAQLLVRCLHSEGLPKFCVERIALYKYLDHTGQFTAAFESQLDAKTRAAVQDALRTNSR